MSKMYPCDNPDGEGNFRCPYGPAQISSTCMNQCGLGVDEDAYESEDDEYDEEEEVTYTPWTRFLIDHAICHPDEIGNMPCDNGMICDRCSADWIQEEYEEWLKERRAELSED